MKYRRIAEMTESEIREVLEILFQSDARLIRYEKCDEHNYIQVYYSLPSDSSIHRIDLLPDNVYDMDEGEISGDELADGNLCWEYEKFVVARGYSELWESNYY